MLAHSVRHASGQFKKGRLLSVADIAMLQDSGVKTVFAARLSDDDVPEDAAARALANSICGGGAVAQAPFTGRANLHAATAGIALIDQTRIRKLNHLHESLTVATVAPFEAVTERQMLATVKIIPFAAPREAVDRALDLIADEPLVKVAAFSQSRVGLITTRLPQTKDSLITKSENAMRSRLTELGSRLGACRVVEHKVEEVCAAVQELARDHDLVLVFGASAIVDRGDVIPSGVVAAGGEVVHLGMPVDPGNLLMLGRAHGKPVIGVPSCARSPKTNGFDWVLSRLLAGLDVTASDIMDMGTGGLLKEIASRPSPREARPPAAARIFALVLAAGTSSRMGKVNKLLQPVDGKPMVRCAVEAACGSQAAGTVVVTGHESEQLGKVIQDLDVTIVHNPDFAAGVSTSLVRGLKALPHDADGVVVCLGDMPFVSPEQIDRLIAAFDVEEGREICVPVHDGRRGNPVLWGRRFFADMMQISGDRGARGLLAAHDELLVEVHAGSDVIFADFDTKQALAELEHSLD